MRRYFFESVGASYLSALLAYVAQYGLSLLLGYRYWIKILIAPSFVLPIAAAVLAAYLMRKHLSKGSYFVWGIPLGLLLVVFLRVISAPYATHSEVWNTMIGSDCGSSECFFEALFTVPFVCAVCYSVSCAVIQAIRRPRTIDDGATV
jgi:hypothetical protein